MEYLSVNSRNFKKKLNNFQQYNLFPENISKVVANILKDIKHKGDKALYSYTLKFDQANVTAHNIRVKKSQRIASRKVLSKDELTQIKKSIACVKDFHLKTIPQSWLEKNLQGAMVGESFYPIHRVGLYIPGGEVPLASSVVMSAVLAKIAKVPEVVVATPPQKGGGINEQLLAVLDLCGVDEIFLMGGAQAIGALAYGTQSVPSVDKIFGPGNAYVVEAKRQVFGSVGIDLLPGPSEVMVIGDPNSNPSYIAADLLAQAEHGTGKEKIYALLQGKSLVEAVSRELDQQIKGLLHKEKIKSVFSNGLLLVEYDRLEQAIAIANEIAPEHLELHAKESALKKMHRKITTAGAMLIGESTPTVLGDFTAGPSHTLPTGGTGRFFSGMQLRDFYRRTSIVRYDQQSLLKAAPIVKTFSKIEGLDAHGNSLLKRLS